MIAWRSDGEVEFEHPARLCEPVNLAATAAPPLTRALAMDGAYARSGALSTFQIETVRRIHQALDTGGAFLLGDGTGVGKGRCLAGSALEWLSVRRGGRVLWLSANKRLASDALRDAHALDPDERKLRWDRGARADAVDGDARIAFASYAELLQEDRARALREWLAGGAPLLMLDEAHALRHISCAANQTLELLRRLPRAAVLFATATPASAPAHLRYAERLRLWGVDRAFATFDSFAKALTKSGQGAMELVALELKTRGAYLCRSIGLGGVDVEQRVCELARDERRLYDECCDRLRAAGVFGGIAHQLFFQRLLSGFKARAAIEAARAALARGFAVIIAIQGTGQACEERTVDRRAPRRADVCADALVAAGACADGLAFPGHALDRVLEAFGEDAVAQTTGRTHRLVRRGDALVYAAKPSSLRECRAFQEGRKSIAVISRAGSTGISLHAQAADARPRLHICVELPWSSEDFVQQCGRTHRSDAVSAPSYLLLSTDVPAECRFVRGLVHRLRAMGALTRGDRYACDHFFEADDDWACSARREVALWALYADLRARHAPAAVSRAQAMALVRTHAKASASARLLHIYNAARRGDASAPRLLGAMETLLPRALFWRGGVEWTEGTHHAFSPSTRAAIDALRECARHWRTRATLGALPDSVLAYVCALVARRDEVDADGVLEALLAQGVEWWRLPKMPNVTLMNRMFGLSLDDQRALSGVLRLTSETHARQRTGIVDVADYALRNVDDASVYEVRGRCAPGAGPGTTLLHLDVRAAATSSPRRLGAYRCALTGGLVGVAATRGGGGDVVALYAPGKRTPTLLPRVAWEAERAEGRYAEVSDAAWARACDAARARTERVAAGLSRTYALCTGDALSAWEDSLKTIVRVDERFATRPFVGLILRVTRADGDTARACTRRRLGAPRE